MAVAAWKRPVLSFGVGASGGGNTGCCAVAVEPGATEWPEDDSLVTDEYSATVTRKIAALWETIGFQHFKDGIYLRDTAVDHGGILREQRQHLRTLSGAHRASQAAR
ncbi:hypothetical protein ACWCXH_39185 [Kitasatospora sp. NPDC001660]